MAQGHAAGPGLGDRVVGLRNRLLMNPRFQRWAAAFPLTRPIARARARRLFDLVAGFVYSQILFACAQLGVFERLAAGPRTVAELAPELSLSEPAAARLLRAAAALGLLEARGDDRFGLGMLGAAYLGNPGIGAMVAHHAMLYQDLQDPIALLRGEPEAGGALQAFWAYARSAQPAAEGAEKTTGYTELMAASQAMIADEVLSAYSLRRHRRLLDIGGGNGTFLMAAGRQAPHLQLRLFDLPSVAEQARARFAAAGLSDRADAFGGNFFVDPLPGGADLISLVRILHDHDDDRVLALLKNVRRAIPDDGTLLVAEPMAGTKGAEPAGDAYFGFYLLAMGSGRSRTPTELQGLLTQAGFTGFRQVPNRQPLLARVMLCRPAPGLSTGSVSGAPVSNGPVSDGIVSANLNTGPGQGDPERGA